MAGPPAGLRRARPVVAAIGHLESARAYCALLSAARGPDLPPLQPDRIDPLIRRLEPMPVCTIVARSSRGGSIEAIYIDAFLIVDQAWSTVEAVGRVRSAYRAAAATGARLVTLGGFSSIVGECAHLDPSREFGVAFTTGNTLTAAVVAEQVEMVAAADRDRPITVVGAAGDVGSGVCRILAGRGHPLRLVGRRPEPLQELAAELPNTSVSAWVQIAPTSDLVVLVSSAAHGGVSLDLLPAGALVLDAGHPANARTDGRVRYARAGRAHLTCPLETDLPALLDHYRAGELHACLAEGMTLALERRWESFSAGRGAITPARAQEILELAERHGIHPAPLAVEDSA